MRVRVTADHIARGVPGFCWSCPIALAIAESLPGSNPWVVLKIELTYRGRLYQIETPDEALAFMSRFDNDDNRRTLAPFEFDLPLPWEHSETPAASTMAA